MCVPAYLLLATMRDAIDATPPGHCGASRFACNVLYNTVPDKRQAPRRRGCPAGKTGLASKPCLLVRAANFCCPESLLHKDEAHALCLFRSERMRRFCGPKKLRSWLLVISCRAESTQHHTSHRGGRDASHSDARMSLAVPSRCDTLEKSDTAHSLATAYTADKQVCIICIASIRRCLSR